MYYKARTKAMSNNRVYHLAAILWRGKRVIRVGANTYKTHPRFKRVYEDGSVGYHMHAEMDVLRFARPGDIIEVMRFKKSGGFAMARPCKHCMKHIRKAGIKKVRYTNDLSQWEEINL